jgi:hypothetical protein
MSPVTLGTEVKIRRVGTTARGDVARAGVLDREPSEDAAEGVGGRQLRRVKPRVQCVGSRAFLATRRVNTEWRVER